MAAMNAHQLLSPLLTPAETAQMLGVSRRRLASLRRRGAAPRAFIIGVGLIRFDRADVERVAAKHIQPAPPEVAPVRERNA
jgi:predicted DNA-binding transcriptional regulator AlpA